MGVSAKQTGLGSAEAPEPPSRLGPTDAIPNALKPCPFCGSEAIIEMIRARSWMARCGRYCDVNKYGKTKLTTAAAWNARFRERTGI